MSYNLKFLCAFVLKVFRRFILLCFILFFKVWSHFDGGNCPGAAVGVKCRLDSGVTGFIHTKNISDKMVRDPEERVQVRKCELNIMKGWCGLLVFFFFLSPFYT